MQSFDIIQCCGFRKPIFTLTQADIPQLIDSLIMHACIYERKAEMDQLILGLQKAGVLEMIRQHPSFFQPLFLKSASKLCAGWSWYNTIIYCGINVTADDIMALFEKRIFSEAGTNELKREQATYMMYKDLLEELDGIIYITILNFIMPKLFSYSYLTLSYPWTLTYIHPHFVLLSSSTLTS